MATIELNAYLAEQWPGLGQVYQIKRERWDKKGHSVELAYRITSLDRNQADAARLLDLDRGHWGIENSLHHVRDVTMGEDACRVRSGHAAQFLAATRNVVLCLSRKLKAKSIAAAFRRFMVHPREALELLNRKE